MFETTGKLRLADLRRLAEPYPVLQSLRATQTQEFAKDCRSQGLDGIIYASAQQPHHDCTALFLSASNYCDSLPNLLARLAGRWWRRATGALSDVGANTTSFSQSDIELPLASPASNRRCKHLAPGGAGGGTPDTEPPQGGFGDSGGRPNG